MEQTLTIPHLRSYNLFITDNSYRVLVGNIERYVTLDVTMEKLLKGYPGILSTIAGLIILCVGAIAMVTPYYAREYFCAVLILIFFCSGILTWENWGLSKRKMELQSQRLYIAEEIRKVLRITNLVILQKMLYRDENCKGESRHCIECFLEALDKITRLTPQDFRCNNTQKLRPFIQG